MRAITVTVLIFSVLGIAACGRTDGPSPESTDAADQRAAEQEAAARQEAERQKQRAVEDARGRLDAVRSELAGLRSAAEPVSSRIDAALRDAIDELTSRTGEVERTIERLADAGTDGWESTEAEIRSALDDLSARLEQVSANLEAQKQVLSRRSEEQRGPIVGLIEGLDGGDYDAYRVSVVRDVQQALKDEGYYPGPVDGYLGRPTMEALSRFQQDHGVAPSGVPSPETRKRLLEGQG